MAQFVSPHHQQRHLHHMHIPHALHALRAGDLRHLLTSCALAIRGCHKATRWVPAVAIGGLTGVTFKPQLVHP